MCRRSLTSLLLFCIFVVLWLSPCRAQPAKPLGSETVEAVSLLMDSARAEGLPAETLMQKALEGSTKGASDLRIREAVHALLNRLRLAKKALGGDATQPELTAAAGAIYAGVDTNGIRRLKEARAVRKVGDMSHDQTLAAEFVVLTDLISRNVPIETASQVVIGLAEANVGFAEIFEFRRMVEQDIRSGVVPAESAYKRARKLAPSLPPFGQESAHRRGDSR
jgi:hypothetical protein